MAELQRYFYLRDDADTDARGPYRLEQLISLAEAGHLDRDTLYYNEEREEWLTIAEDEELLKEVFPEKKGLSLAKPGGGQTIVKSGRGRETESGGNTEDELPGVSVDEALAAAEGRTEETKHLRKRERESNLAAVITTPLLGVMMTLMSVALLYLHVDLLMRAIPARDWMQLLEPILVVGLVDLVLAILLFLSVTDLYPLLRVRGIAGIGFFGYIFWAGGGTFLALATIVIGLALLVTTLSLRLYTNVILLAGGILAASYLCFQSFMGVLGTYF
jgi:hypothetical protein